VLTTTIRLRFDCHSTSNGREIEVCNWLPLPCLIQVVNTLAFYGMLLYGIYKFRTR